MFWTEALHQSPSSKFNVHMRAQFTVRSSGPQALSFKAQPAHSEVSKLVADPTDLREADIVLELDDV